jgi:hypothetical protein
MTLQDTPAFQALTEDLQVFLLRLKLDQKAGELALSKMRLVGADLRGKSSYFIFVFNTLEASKEVDAKYHDYEIELILRITKGIVKFYWNEKTASNDMLLIPEGMLGEQKEGSGLKEETSFQAVTKISGALSESKKDMYLTAAEAHLQFFDSFRIISRWQGIQFNNYSKFLKEWISQLIKLTQSWKHYFFSRDTRFTAFQKLPVIDKQLLFKSLEEYVQTNYGPLFFQHHIAEYSIFLYLQLLHLSDGNRNTFYQLQILFYKFYNSRKTVPKDFVVMMIDAYGKQFEKQLNDFEQQLIFTFTYFYHLPYLEKAKTINDLIKRFRNQHLDTNIDDLAQYENYYLDWKMITD